MDSGVFIMKKVLISIVAVVIACCFLVGCDLAFWKKNDNEKKVDPVVLTPDSSAVGKSLLEYMESEKENGRLVFIVSDKMVTSIKGVENENPYYWMLYTDDEEITNSAWGSYEYNGKTYVSTSFGAADITIVEGKSYLWAYRDINQFLS